MLKKKNRRRKGLSWRRRAGQLVQRFYGSLKRLKRKPKSRPLPPSEAVRRTAPTPEPDTDPRGLDLVLLTAALALVGIGMVMVFSSSAIFSQARHDSVAFFLKRHAIYAGFGLFALYLGYRIDHRLYQRWVYLVLGGTLLVLAALLVPGLGTRVDGAVRWFRFAGISIQPSEPAKFALICYLAYSLAKKRATMRSFSVGFLPHLCVAGFMALLVLRQPDLGTAAILMSVTLVMLVVAGTKISYVVLALLAAFPLAYQQIVGTPWRLRRLLAFLDPWAYRQDAGYQIAESLISVGSGGLYGQGLGEGKQKLFFLPASHTDFIFAIIGEELGLIGLIAVVLLFGIIVLRGLRASFGADDLFGSYLAHGITALLALQGVLHMAVVLGLVPTKGITLPLVSYGGSALVTNMFLVGVLLNIAARHPTARPFRLPRWGRAISNRRRPTRVTIETTTV